MDVLLNRLVDPPVVALLRSPLHRLLSSRILVVETRGRRTGRRRRIPVGYERAGGTLVVRSSARRVWWRNLEDGAPTRLWLAGRPVEASARVEIAGTAVTVRFTPASGRIGP